MNLQELYEQKMIAGKPKYSGVYFMFSNEEIVYIGRSENVANAVEMKGKRGVQYDRYSYIPFSSPEKALRAAVLYILKHQPKDNTGIPKNDLFIPSKQLKKSYGIDRLGLNQWLRDGLIEMHMFGSDIYLKISEIEKILEKKSE